MLNAFLFDHLIYRVLLWTLTYRHDGNLYRICTFVYLNYVIVMVYVQLHIPVALLWGICLWKEITQTIEIVSLAVLVATLIGGMVLTTYGVYGAIF